MKSGRTTLSTLAILVAVIGTTIVPVFASDARGACATRQHDCGRTATIIECCCGDQGDASNQGGLIESRVQLNASLTPVPAVFVTTVFPSLHRTIARPHTSAPRATPLDLPTLFASLLI